MISITLFSIEHKLQFLYIELMEDESYLGLDIDKENRGDISIFKLRVTAC